MDKAFKHGQTALNSRAVGTKTLYMASDGSSTVQGSSTKENGTIIKRMEKEFTPIEMVKFIMEID